MDIDKEVQPNVEMAMKIPVTVATGGGGGSPAATPRGATALGSNRPLPLLLPWTWCWCQFLFSAGFVFRRSCTGNILRIRRNESRSSYFTVTKTESREETEKSQEAAAPCLGAGRPLAAPRGGVAPSGTHPPGPSAYIFICSGKT
jgi:hypothetical protein